jgi:hypothetical protein
MVKDAERLAFIKAGYRRQDYKSQLAYRVIKYLGEIDRRHISPDSPYSLHGYLVRKVFELFDKLPFYTFFFD